jgi:hypothetical protein
MAVSFLFKRSSTANAQPTVGNLADGELNVTNNASSPGIFLKDSAGSLVKVGPATQSVTAPTNPTVGSTWLDTTGPWLNVRAATSWYRTASPGTSSRVLGSLSGVQTPLHVWSTRQWVSTSATAKLGSRFTCCIQTPNSPNQQIYVPASTNNTLQNSWPATIDNGESDSLCQRFFDQTGNRTLIGNVLWYWPAAGITGPPLVGNLWGPVPSNADNATRYWKDNQSTIPQATEQGPAFWCIIQFNLSAPNSNNGQIVMELWSSENTYGNGSLTIQRGTGSNLLISRRVDGTDPYMFNNNIVCDTTQYAKNTLLYYDNGTGNVQMSINGSALVAGNTSRNQDYVIGNGGVNIGGADYQPNSRNLNCALCTAAYWVGSTANCPTAATLQSLASQMHSLI